MDNASDLVSIIKEIVDQKIQNLDQTSLGIVDSVNEDGTVNVFILPDMNKLISGIHNESKYELKNKDVVLIFKIKNRLQNAFIITKYW